MAWTLVGRDEELDIVTSGLRAGGSIVIAGSAGVGKTRLAQEALTAVGDGDATTAWAVASQSSRAIPFGALAPLLPILEDLPESRLALLRRVSLAFSQMAATGRLILAVDDAHLLDDMSATLLLHLVQEERVSLVLTIRTGEPAPDAVSAIWKDGFAARLDLQPLSQEEGAQMVSSGVDGDAVDGAFVHQVCTAAGGNPLYLRELVTGAIESGALRKVRAVWHLERPFEAPDRLIELIEGRLAVTTDASRRALELLAVTGSIGLASLEELSPPEAIDDLERRGIVVMRRDERRRPVELAHPLYGEALRRTMPAGRSRELQREAADLIDRAGRRRRGDTLRVATLRLDSDGTADPVLLADAARQAACSYDLELAERVSRAALAAGAGGKVRRLLAEILRFRGRHDDARAVIESIDPADLDEDEAMLLAITHAEILFRGLGRKDDAHAVLAAAQVGAGPEWRDEFIAMGGGYDVLSGRVREGLATLEPLLDLPPGRALVTACGPAAAGLLVAGRGEQAVQIAERAFEISLSLGQLPMLADPGLQVIARCLALAEMGRLSDARVPAELGYEWGVASGIAVGHGWFAMILGRVALGAGELQRASQRFQEAAAVFASSDEPGLRRWCLAGAAQAVALVGDGERATALVAELDASPGAEMGLMEPEVDRARAWAAVARGELTAGRAILRAAAEGATADGRYALASSAWHDLVRLGDVADVDELSTLQAKVDGPLIPVRADHGRALAAGDGDALADVAERFAEIGANLLGAEAAAQAAAVATGNGRRRQAAAADARSRELAALCDGARTPALLIDRELVELSPREREVAALAAAGLGNREIAERLFVSVRTVENHLQRAYDKLGVAGRAELAARYSSL
jgi:DNA-binding CsgD family transcriptional regulator